MSLSKKTLLEALTGFKIQFTAYGDGIIITPPWADFGEHKYEYFIIDEVGDDIFRVKSYTDKGVLSGSKYMSTHQIYQIDGALFK